MRAHTHTHTHTHTCTTRQWRKGKIPGRCTICDTTCCSTPCVLRTSPDQTRIKLNCRRRRSKARCCKASCHQQDTTGQDSAPDARAPPACSGSASKRRRDTEAKMANLCASILFVRHPMQYVVKEAAHAHTPRSPFVSHGDTSGQSPQTCRIGHVPYHIARAQSPHVRRR